MSTILADDGDDRERWESGRRACLVHLSGGCGSPHVRLNPDPNPLPPVRPTWVSVLAIIFSAIVIIMMWRAMG